MGTAARSATRTIRSATRPSRADFCQLGGRIQQHGEPLAPARSGHGRDRRLREPRLSRRWPLVDRAERERAQVPVLDEPHRGRHDPRPRRRHDRGLQPDDMGRVAPRRDRQRAWQHLPARLPGPAQDGHESTPAGAVHRAGVDVLDAALDPRLALVPGGGEQEPGDWTYSAARVYICVDQDWDGTGTVHPNGACDTRETGDRSGRERWEPLEAWYSPETSYRRDNEVNCMYDPSDDGSTETDFFPNSVTMGPSSTCLPTRRRHLRRTDTQRRRHRSDPGHPRRRLLPGDRRRGPGRREGLRGRSHVDQRPVDPQALPPRRVCRPQGPLPLAHRARRGARRRELRIDRRSVLRQP